MKKLLVLGAGEYQLPLIEAAKKLGVYVITITPDGPYPGIQAADKVYYHDARDEEYACSVGIKEEIDGVISDQGEIFVRPVAYVAEKLNLPGNGYETACLYTDKSRMRERSKELGLATIESVKVRSLEEAIDAFDKISGKAIIKPVDSFSSRGVSKISNQQDLQDCWEEAKSYSGSGDVILERFVVGPQFEVDSIAAHGHVKPLMYADMNEFNIPNVFSSATRLYPSVADERTVQKLLEYSNKINEGFGMKQGVSHNEYIMDDDTGEIFLIEAALRGGGTYIGSHIAYLETGVDVADFLVKVALDLIPDIPEFVMNQCHAGYVCFYLPKGKVVSVDGIDAVEKLDYVAKTKYNGLHVGQVIDSLEDKDQRCAIILHAKSRAEMMQRISTIREMVRVEVETTEGIKGPIWE